MSALNRIAALVAAPAELDIRVHRGDELTARLPALAAFAHRGPRAALSTHPAWLSVLRDGLGHTPYALEALRGGRTVGVLSLAFVKSLLFGRFLVGLPYVNYGGVVADGDAVAEAALIAEAARLADELDVRYLELRNEWAVEHPRLTHRRVDKVHMRMDLPPDADVLWKQLDAKVRNQVRKGQKGQFAVHWGGDELLDDFVDVFSHNMRDLGTPSYGRALFAAILRQFPGEAELCIVRAGPRPAAAALLLHGRGVTEVPSASTLRAYNPACANMLLYWHLLERAVERGQEVFDFGRSTEDGPTHRFKKQWGAAACSAEWQYYLRNGGVGTARPDNPKYRRMIAVWRRLPLPVARRLGPWVVRGIP